VTLTTSAPPDDKAVTNGTKYFYGAFSYDTTKQLFGPEATATGTPTCPTLPKAGQRPVGPTQPWVPALVVLAAAGATCGAVALRRRT
jgi:hypothetical protein